MSDCSLGAYAQAFNKQFNQCLSKQGPLISAMGGDSACVTQAAINALREMNAKCARSSGVDCTPKGYVAVIAKPDNGKKVVEFTLKKVTGKAVNTLLTPSAVGCGIGAVIGGVSGAIVGKSLVSASLGAAAGCKLGTTVAEGTYQGYKYYKKIGKAIDTVKEAKQAIKDLKEHSNRCKAVPFDSLRSNDSSFIEGAQQNGLTEGYNGSNPENPIPESGASGGEIGGVGNSVGVIEGLFAGYNDFRETQHYFFIPSIGGKPPFTQEELNQILREVALCEYVEETVGFVSMHFNAESNLYTVMHPAVQKMFIGAKVIAPLDYLLKGFLNGSFYPEAFIQEWQKSKTQDPSILKANSIDLHAYCQQHLPDQPYFSLPELIAIFEKEEAEKKAENLESDLLSDYSGFRSSFRIIGKQNSIRKEGNLFILDGDFDLFYTIKPDPVYAEELRKYRLQFGHDPSGYRQLVQACEAMVYQIKKMMPRLPGFREKIEQLKVINFFSYYFRTLKRHQKIPLLESWAGASYAFPSELPHLPIRKIRREKLNLNLEKVFEKLSVSEKKKIADFLSSCSLESFTVPKEILTLIEPVFKKRLQESSCIPLSEDQSCIDQHRQLIQHFLQEVAIKSKASLLEAKELLSERKAQHEKTEAYIKTHQDLLMRQKEEIATVQKNISECQEAIKNLRAKEAEAKSMVGKATQASIDAVLAEVYSKIQLGENFLKDHQETLASMSEHAKKIAEAIQSGEKNKENLEKDNASLQEIVHHPIDFSFKSSILPLTFSHPMTEVFSEIPADEGNQIKRIVGGCGLKLDRMTITPDFKAQEIATENFISLQQAEIGEWISIQRNGKPDGHAFKLQLKNYAASQKEDYQWMQYALIQEDPDTAILKYEMFSALQLQDLRAFKKKTKWKEGLGVNDTGGANIVHHAASTTAPEFLQALIDAGVSLTLQDPLGYTPLHYAAREGNLRTMEMLLKHCPQLLNMKGSDQATPLYIAVQHNRLAAVQFLLKYPETLINQRTTHGMTPLYCAIHHGCEAIVLELLKQQEIDPNVGLEDGTTPLFAATELELLESVKGLLSKGADAHRCRVDTMAPLHIAAKKGSLAICSLLLNHPGVDPNIQMRSGKTALHLAAESNQYFIVQELLAHGALLTTFGWDHETAFLTAVRHGNLLAACPMIPHLAQSISVEGKSYRLIDLPDFAGDTPLKIALERHFYAILDLLFQHSVSLPGTKECLIQFCKAKIDPLLIQQILKTNPLPKEALKEIYYAAAKYGHNQMVSLFQDLYPLEDFCDEQGWTVAHFAAKYDHVDLIARFLKTSPQDILKKDEAGNTLAAIAAQEGSSRVLKLLLHEMHKQKSSLDNHCQNKHLLFAAVESGSQGSADLIIHHMTHPNVVLDSMGRYATHIAAKNGDVEMLSLLKARGADFTLCDKKDRTVFHDAYDYQWNDVIHFLLEIKNEFPIPGNLLCFVAAKGSAKEISKLIKKGCNPNTPHSKDKTTPIFFAIRTNNIEAVQALIAHGADLTYRRTPQGNTPLLLAAALGKTEIVRILIAHIDGIQQKTEGGKTALHVAAERGQEECVEYLISQGFDPTMKDKQGNTAHDLAKKGNFLPIEYLLKGEEASLTLKEKKALVIQALRLGDEELFFREMRHFPLNGSIVFDLEGQQQRLSLLHLIYHCSRQHEGAKKILDRFLKLPKVDKNIQDEKGQTLFHLMANHGEKWDAGTVDLSQRDLKDVAIFHYYVEHAQPKELKELLKKNLSLIAIQDNEGRNPLHYAIRSNQQGNVEVLLKYGADPNCLTKQRVSPLIIATLQESPLMVQQLLSYGANPNQACLDTKQTALHFAAEKKQGDIVNLLLTHGAHVNQADIDGVLPLHLAAKQGNLPIVSLLLAAGSSLRAKDHSGNTLFHYAAQSDQPRLLEVLKELGLSYQKQTKILQPSLRKSKNQISGIAPIHFAAQRGRLNTLKWLVAHQAPMDAVVEDSLGLLFYAASSGKREILQIFENHPLMKESHQRVDAIRGAVLKDAVKQLKILYRDYPADCALDALGTTGLALAAKSGALRCAHYLVKQGADPQKMNFKQEAPFELAVKSHHLAIAHHFVKASKNFDLHRTMQEGKTYLHLACEHLNVEMASWLIELGICIDQPDSHGCTPLHDAAKKGSYPLLHLLLACGADSSKKSGDGKTAIELLPSQGAEALKALILNYQQEDRKRAENQESCLHLAIRLNDLHHLPLLAKIHDVNLPNNHGETALHLAALKKDLRYLHALIKLGADKERKDAQGRTPLFLAASKANHHNTLLELIKLGADLNTENHEEETLLYAVTKRPDPLVAHPFFDLIYAHLCKQSVVDELFTSFQNVKTFYRWIHSGHSVNKDHLSPVIMEDNPDILDHLLTWFKLKEEWLLESVYTLDRKKSFSVLHQHRMKEADLTLGKIQEIFQKDDLSSLLNVPSNLLDFKALVQENGNSALHVAAKNNACKIAKFLIWYGLDLKLANQLGNTPLHMACHFQHQQIAQLFLEQGAPVHAVNQKGWTPFSLALQNPLDSELAASFKHFNADFNYVHNGLSQSQRAAQENKPAIMQGLLEIGIRPMRFSKNDSSEWNLILKHGHAAVLKALCESACQKQEKQMLEDLRNIYQTVKGKPSYMKFFQEYPMITEEKIDLLRN